MHLDVRWRPIFPNSLLFRRQLEGARRKAKEVIPTPQPPAILWVLAGILPLDPSVRGNDADLAAIVIATEKTAGRLDGTGRDARCNDEAELEQCVHAATMPETGRDF